MSYYLNEARNLGIKATKFREVIEEVFQEPTQPRLLLLGAIISAVRMSAEPESDFYHQLDGLTGIIWAERDYLRAQEDTAWGALC